MPALKGIATFFPCLAGGLKIVALLHEYSANQILIIVNLIISTAFIREL